MNKAEKLCVQASVARENRTAALKKLKDDGALTTNPTFLTIRDEWETSIVAVCNLGDELRKGPG